jgi:ADP-heptose:LPS heptosyltransferase
MTLDLGPLNRVLAVRLDNAGDVVMLGPALRALRRALPQATIALLCSPAGSHVTPMLPWVDDALVAEQVSWQDASGDLPHDPTRERALIDRLRAHRFDAAFVFTSWAQSPHPPAYACYLASIPVRVGESKEFAGSVLSHYAPSLPDEAHQVDRNLHLVVSVGVAPAGTDLELRIPPAAARSAAGLLEGLGGPYAVLAPGASCPSRRYPAERFAQVARGLDLPAVIVGAEREAGLASEIQAAAPRARSLVGRTTLPELAAVIARAAVVVANNSAPMHIADALRRPLVALFGGTELESQFAPRAAPRRVLRRPTWCTPCHAFMCAFGLECLDVPARDVVTASHELMEAMPACTDPCVS